MPAWGWLGAATVLSFAAAYAGRRAAASGGRLAVAWLIHALLLAGVAAGLPSLSPWAGFFLFLASFPTQLKCMTYLTADRVEPGLGSYLIYVLVPFALAPGDVRRLRRWGETGRIAAASAGELAVAAALGAAALQAPEPAATVLLVLALFGSQISAVGIVTVLHHLAGFAVSPPLDQPYRAMTLAEFWGRRWNRPFHRMAMDAIFRPAARRWSAGAGSFLVFFYSGAIHEALINGTIGTRPGFYMAFFLLQGAGIAAERRFGWRDRAWVLVFLAATGALFFVPVLERLKELLPL